MNKKEREHLGRVADLGCIICQMPACCHHIRAGQGMGQRASHYETIPLCFDHHSQQGKDGIHKAMKTWQAKHGNETDLLRQTIEAIYGDNPREWPEEILTTAKEHDYE